MQAERPQLRLRLDAPPPARRILVIRLGALGDVVRTRFAFAALRRLYPDARIDWLVEDRAAAGLEAIRGLDGVIRVARKDLRPSRPTAFLRGASALVRELRSSRYELSVDFHGILKSALLARAAGVPVRVGFARGIAREGAAALQTHSVSFEPRHVSRFARNDALVRYLGGEPIETAPEIELPSDAAGPDAPPAPLVVMHPGTSESTLYKRWAPGRWAVVAREIKVRAGFDSIVSWGPVPGEREAAEAVVSAAGGAARLAPETGSVTEVLSLMRGQRLFLGSDSGPMHLASIAGLPVVVVFGPTDPVENAPYPGTPHRLLRRDVGCNPCRLGCPTRACMAAVDPYEVARAALELLQPG